jgi:DNA-binding NarL/FixJ family response regulator
MILLAMDDRALIRRWSEAVRICRADHAVIDPKTLSRPLSADAAVCVFDLGSRARADLSFFSDAVTGNRTTHFVALTACPNAEEGLDILRAGGRGYCNRLASPPVGSAVLATVGDGEIWAGRQVTEHLLKRAPSPAASAAAGEGFQMLTTRESEIAAQVAAGQSNKAIAAENGIAERTVKAHLNSIFRKTGLRSRVQLALAFNSQDPVAAKSSNG